jgi:hypothetical protein
VQQNEEEGTAKNQSRRNGTCLVCAQAYWPHLQLKLYRHLLLQFCEIVYAAHVSAPRTLSPRAHHMMHRPDRNSLEECQHCGGVVAVDAACSHAWGIRGADFSARGLELLGVAADDPRDAAAEREEGVRECQCGSEGGGRLQLEYSFGGSFAHTAAAAKNKNCLATQWHMITLWSMLQRQTAWFELLSSLGVSGYELSVYASNYIITVRQMFAWSLARCQPWEQPDDELSEWTQLNSMKSVWDW